MNIRFYNHIFEVFLMVLLGMSLSLLGGTSSASAQQDTSELYIGEYAEVNPEAKNFIAAGRTYKSMDEYQKAKERFLKSIELEPLYWRGWSYLAMTMRKMGQLRQAANAYAKTIDLRKRCDEGLLINCINSEVLEYEWKNAVYDAGLTFLDIGEYALAAETLSQAQAMFEDRKRRAAVEWMAVARFGETDVATAWKDYRRLFPGEPFPTFNEEGLSAKKARKARKPPDGFYRLLHAGMKDLRYEAYQADHLFYELFHAQNVARLEALKEKATRDRDIFVPYESEEAREYLVALFLKIKFSSEDYDWKPENSKLEAEPGFRIQPALSRYAVETARQAERAVDRKKYQEAEDLYRLALATDPWWQEGQMNRARLEFINYGYCGPSGTLDFIEELAEMGAHFRRYYTEMSFVIYTVRPMQLELKAIFREAKASGSTRLEGWCNIPRVSTIKPDIELR